MFCEKCGKKISYKKTQCDSCKHPVEYEGFSKLEYEPVKKSEVTVAAVPKAEGFVRPVYSAPPAKSPGLLIAIVSAVVALVIIIGVVLGVLIAGGPSDVEPEQPQIAEETEEETILTITSDATLKVKINGEAAEKYTYSVKKASAEEIKLFEGNEQTGGRLCPEGEVLEVGATYEISVKGDGSITKSDEIITKAIVSDKVDAKDLKTEVEVVLVGFTDEEIYAKDVFAKYEGKEYSYANVDFDDDLKKELIIKEDARKYTIYCINGHKAEKVKKGEFEADEIFLNQRDKAFYGKLINNPENENDDKYFRLSLKDGIMNKEELEKKPDDLGLPYTEFKSRSNSVKN